MSTIGSKLIVIRRVHQVRNTYGLKMKSPNQLILVPLLIFIGKIYCKLIYVGEQDVIIDDPNGNDYPIGAGNEIWRKDDVNATTTAKPAGGSKNWIIIVAAVLGTLLLLLLLVACFCCCCKKKKEPENAPKAETSSAPTNTSSSNPASTKTYPSFDQLQKI